MTECKSKPDASQVASLTRHRIERQLLETVFLIEGILNFECRAPKLGQNQKVVEAVLDRLADKTAS